MAGDSLLFDSKIRSLFDDARRDVREVLLAILKSYPGIYRRREEFAKVRCPDSLSTTFTAL